MNSLGVLQQEAAIWGNASFDWKTAYGPHLRRELELVVAYQLADAALICLGKSAQSFTRAIVCS